MKITAKMFGVLCAASLMFCAACDGIGNKPEDEDNEGKDKTELDNDKDKGDLNNSSNNDNDSDKDDDGKKDDEVTYAVGSTVTISNVKYLVIKNTEAGDTVADKSPAYSYYPNERADAYRDQLIKKYEVKEPYVLVFNTETTKSTTTNVTYWDDEYRILRNGVTHYRIRYRWENLIPNIATITADELRKGYDPSGFVIDNYSADYGSDLSKKFFRTYRFNYDDGGNTITYRDDNWRQTEDYIDFVYVKASGKERNQYQFTDRISSHARSYILRNPNDTDTNNSNTFFEFRVDLEEDDVTPRSYRLIANGKGATEGGTNNKLYQSSLYIGSLRYWPDGGRGIWFSVDTKKNNVSDPKLIFDDLYERKESDDTGGDSGSGNGGNDNTGGDTGTGDDNKNDNTDSDSSETDKNGQTESGSASGTRTVVVKNEGVGKYVTVSERETTVNGIKVPETITFSVPFEDENAPMSKFTKVTFVPQAKDDYVIYVPKTGSKTAYEFIDTFKAGYDIFGEYTWTKPTSTSTPSTDSSVTLQDDAAAKADTSTAHFDFTGTSMKIEVEAMTTNGGIDITTDSAASGGKAGLLANEDSRAEAIITFPAGNYTGYAVIYAPSGDSDAFYVKFGDGHIRVYADDPTPKGYERTGRTPIKLSCDQEVTVRMVISPRSEKFTSKAVETGMYIDYVEFTKN